MKYTALFAIYLLFIFGSCKKQAIAPPGNIAATVDSINLKFNTYTKAQIITDTTGKTGPELLISGQTGTDSARIIIYIAVIAYQPNTQITSGTYLSYSTNRQSAYAYISYFPVDPKTNIASPWYSDISGYLPTTITISSISSRRVQGTFNGKLVYYFSIIGTETQDETKVIANGKFDAEIE
jgi:hypothetical protein